MQFFQKTRFTEGTDNTNEKFTKLSATHNYEADTSNFTPLQSFIKNNNISNSNKRDGNMHKNKMLLSA